MGTQHHHTTMQVITVSIFLVLTIMTVITQTRPDVGAAQTRGSCADSYPRWCYKSFKNTNRVHKLCDVNANLCKKTCGLCKESDSEPDKDDPCYCDGPRCELSPDCFRK